MQHSEPDFCEVTIQKTVCFKMKENIT